MEVRLEVNLGACILAVFIRIQVEMMRRPLDI